jgi:hypothetical protein
MNHLPKIKPEIVLFEFEDSDPHQWCRTFEVTNFGDSKRRYLDHRCAQCRAVIETQTGTFDHHGDH